jgi:hypothetical protein
MVNSVGTSTYSAITFTPPADTSVIMQSRGNEPVPNWIFATLLHRRRSLLRRFTSMLIPQLFNIGYSAFPAVLKKNYWNLPSDTSRNVSIPLEVFLPSSSAMSGKPYRGGPISCLRVDIEADLAHGFAASATDVQLGALRADAVDVQMAIGTQPRCPTRRARAALPSRTGARRCKRRHSAASRNRPSPSPCVPRD